MKMKNSGFWVLIAIIAMIGIVFGFFIERPYTFHGSLIDPAVPAPKFTLDSSQGGSYHLEERKGKFQLVFFGYTHCPDVCPATLFEMKEIKSRLKDNSEYIEFLFITVDPDRDTQEQLSR